MACGSSPRAVLKMRMMKELDPIKKEPKLEITQEKEQEYKLTYLDTITPHPNHRLYEIDPGALIISEAEFTIKDYVFNPYWKKGDKIPTHAEVIVKEGMVYVSAMNKAQAIKKYNQGMNGSKDKGLLKPLKL